MHVFGKAALGLMLLANIVMCVEETDTTAVDVNRGRGGGGGRIGGAGRGRGGGRPIYRGGNRGGRRGGGGYRGGRGAFGGGGGFGGGGLGGLGIIGGLAGDVASTLGGIGLDAIGSSLQNIVGGALSGGSDAAPVPVADPVPVPQPVPVSDPIPDQQPVPVAAPEQFPSDTGSSEPSEGGACSASYGICSTQSPGSCCSSMCCAVDSGTTGSCLADNDVKDGFSCYTSRQQGMHVKSKVKMTYVKPYSQLLRSVY